MQVAYQSSFISMRVLHSADVGNVLHCFTVLQEVQAPQQVSCVACKLRQQQHYLPVQQQWANALYTPRTTTTAAAAAGRAVSNSRQCKLPV
jgi:hypothetical protein